MTKLTFNQKRIGAAILLALAFFCVANLLLDLHVFGNYDWEVFALLVIVMIFYVNVIGPSKREIEEYRKKMQRERNSSD